MFNQLLLWVTLLVPWFSLFLAKSSSIKRYMPVVLLSVLLLTVVQEIAYSQNWWINLARIVPWGDITNVSLIYGLFAIGTFWIFYFTYRSFWLFLLTNAVTDGLWLLLAPPLLERLQIFRFANMGALGLFLICIASALVLYVYQMWQESIFRKEITGNGRSPLMAIVDKLSGAKEPAR